MTYSLPEQNEKKLIRFIDSHYNTQFYLEDEQNLIMTFSDNRMIIGPCHYIDPYHFSYQNRTWHICEFAEFNERNGNTCRPEQGKDPLMQFIEQEVPFRLEEIHGIDDANQDMVVFITKELQKCNDVMFDYDALDSFILDKIKSYQAEHGTKPLEAMLNKIENKNTHDAAEKEIEPQHLTR